MVKCLWQIGKKIVGLVCKLIDSIIYILPVYYTSIEKITIRRWFNLQSGNLKAFYKLNLGYVPKFFNNLYFDLSLMFENKDLTIITEMANIARLKSMAARTNDKAMDFQAECQKTELKAKLKANENKKALSMNEFIDYIELSLESVGRINPDEMSISRAHSLYNKAIEHNKRIKEIYK